MANRNLELLKVAAKLLEIVRLSGLVSVALQNRFRLNAVTINL